jgi:tetratricopeptide (TPR) repeat protein
VLTKKDKLLAAAQKFLERGSLDKALLEFQRAAQEDAKDTRTWLRIAEIHVKRGESDQATAVYLKTAGLYVEQGFFQRAAAVYKNVLKLTPGHTDAHIKLAEVYRQLGLLSDSSQQYELGAGALVRASKPKEAMAALAQVIEMNPDQVMVRVKIAEVAAQAGLTDDAVNEFTRAAEQLEQQGRTDDFLRVAERLLQLAPENTALGKRAAIRYMERQNPKAALAKLQACFNIDRKDAETLQLLANAFTELGQTAKTVTVLKELAQIQEERRQTVERAATMQRIRALDPSAATATGSFSAVDLNEMDLPRPRVSAPIDPVTPPGMPTAERRTRREPTITFSELAVPPILAREPSDTMMLAVPDLDDEQVATEVARILTETDTFVKYGLTERAAEHIRKVFELAPEHAVAQERLIAILIQIGRNGEAVEELGILADRLSLSDPDAAIRHLHRALELDPTAVGARHMLSRLEGSDAVLELDAEGVVEQLDQLDNDELGSDELDIDQLDLVPIVDEPEAGAPGSLIDDGEAAREWQPGPSTEVEAPELLSEFAARTMLTPGLGVPAVEAASDAPPAIDELEIDFDLPVSASAPAAPPAPRPPAVKPLDASIMGELEQVDFFLEQNLPAEALAVLDDLGKDVAGHPEIEARRARAESMNDTEFTRAQGGPGLGSLIGGLPAEPAAPRPPSRESAITPRAVMASGGTDPVTQRDLGIAYKEMGLHDAAIREFSKLSEDPDHQVFALMMIGECHEAEGAYGEALLHYKKALNRPTVREDEATSLYFALGRAFEALGDQGEALYFFEKVARRDQRFADVASRVERLRKSGVAPVDRAGADDRRRVGGAGTTRGSR